MTAAAHVWISRLRERGITVALRGNRLWLQPASAYKQLTDEELLFLRHNREVIKLAVREGTNHHVEHAAETAKPVAAAMSPEIARLVNWHTPEEVERRQAEATSVMLERLGKPNPWLAQ